MKKSTFPCYLEVFTLVAPFGRFAKIRQKDTLFRLFKDSTFRELARF